MALALAGLCLGMPQRAAAAAGGAAAAAGSGGWAHLPPYLHSHALTAVARGQERGAEKGVRNPLHHQAILSMECVCVSCWPTLTRRQEAAGGPTMQAVAVAACTAVSISIVCAQEEGGPAVYGTGPWPPMLQVLPHGQPCSACLHDASMATTACTM